MAKTTRDIDPQQDAHLPAVASYQLPGALTQADIERHHDDEAEDGTGRAQLLVPALHVFRNDVVEHHEDHRAGGKR